MEKDELKKLQEKHRKEAQEIRAGIKARKKRTHRLIVHGAILEKVVPETADMFTGKNGRISQKSGGRGLKSPFCFFRRAHLYITRWVMVRSAEGLPSL